jgi:hypothetical protein
MSTHPDRIMNYVECDLGVEVTLPQWRHARATGPRRHRLRTLASRCRHGGAAAAA